MRKICFILTSKIHYSRSKLILEELKKRPDVELQIVVGASAILKQYGDVESWIKNDGFKVDARITMTLEGGSNVAMAKTAGIGIIEFASVFENLNPDIVVVRGDRYEVLSAAVAAAYMNCMVAHIEGGDVSGNIDESVRHAITKMSHLHFVTNADSRNRVLKMGESPEYVFDVGAPDVEFAALSKETIANRDFHTVTLGYKVDVGENFLILMQHPVTSEKGQNRDNMEASLQAILELGYPTLCFWPNIDAGTDEVSNAIRRYREKTAIDGHVGFIKYLPPGKFIALLKKARCLVGNSSAGIKECSYLGIPVVNVGSRQSGRSRTENVLDVSHQVPVIKEAISIQLGRGYFESSQFYYKENTSKNIADILATVSLYTQKRFVD